MVVSAEMEMELVMAMETTLPVRAPFHGVYYIYCVCVCRHRPMK